MTEPNVLKNTLNAIVFNWSCDLKMVASLTMRPTRGIKWHFLGQVGPIGGHKGVLGGAIGNKIKYVFFFFTV